MAGEFKKAVEQSTALWKRLSTQQRIVTISAAVAVIIGVGYLAFRSPAENYDILFSGLAPEDAGEVITHLKTEKVQYKIEGDGTTIMVPSEQVYELRLLMAQENIPRGGTVGFEIFDKQSLATTSFVEQMNYQRALQGELAKTISSLDTVERARVHIAMGTRSLFRDQDEPPTASVTLQMKTGRTLGKDQVRGIVHLVSSSIEGLKPENVTLLDEGGSILSQEESANGVDDEARKALEEQALKNARDVLGKLFGNKHFAVTVTAEMEYSQTERTEEIFDKDRAAIRSESISKEGNVDSSLVIGGVAGARANLPGAPAPSSQPLGGTDKGKLVETRNYEITHSISKTVGPKSQLKRLHVAVLLDDSTVPAPTPAEGEEPTEEEAAAAAEAAKGPRRSKEELARIKELVSQAVGITPERGDKIEVTSIPFAANQGNDEENQPGVFEWNQLKSPNFLIGGLVVLGLLVFAGLALTRRRRRQAANEPIPLLPVTVSELEAALPATARKIEAARPMLEAASPSARERAIQSVRENAPQAAQILSNWLSEPMPELESSSSTVDSTKKLTTERV